MSRSTVFTTAAVAIALSAHASTAANVQLRVTIENLSTAGGVALSPVTLAAHDGSFDAFNFGAAASLGTRQIAESGASANYIAEATAAFPGVVTGVAAASVNGFGPGIYLPGGSGSIVLSLDPLVNKFLSYGAMVVPSNDHFIGNDSPTAVRLFDDAGNFVAQSFTLTGSRIWDSGTEVNQIFGAAFLTAASGGDHVDQGGVITQGADFSTYAGQLTPAGYTFSSLPTPDGGVARFTFTVVPAPGTAALLGLGALAAVRRRRV